MKTRTPAEEVAEHFGVAIVTVRSWVTKGIIPPDLYLKFGGRYVFDLEGVEAFFRKKTDDEYQARMAKLNKAPATPKPKAKAKAEPAPAPEPEPEPVVQAEPEDDLSWIDDFDEDL